MTYTVALAALVCCLAAAPAWAGWSQPANLGLGADDVFMAVGFATDQVGWVVGANGANGIIKKTTDGGANWVLQDTGALLDGNAVDAIQVIGAQTVIVAAENNHILKTVNGGDSWTVANDSFDFAGMPVGLSFSSGINSGNTGWLSTSGDGAYSHVFKTTNGGVDWALASPVNEPATWLSVDFSDADNGIVVGDCYDVDGASNYVWRTTNGGTSWAKVDLETAQRDVMRGIVNLDATHAWAVGSNGAIFFSSNRGASWARQQPADTSYDLRSLDFVNTQAGWAVGTVAAVGSFANQSVILKTTNGGATWTQQSATVSTSPDVLSTVSMIGVDFVSPTAGFACGQDSSNALLKATNGGDAGEEFVPPAIATLTSSTHPGQAGWYSNNTPAFAWTPSAAADDYSYVLDHDADTTPDDTGEGATGSATYTATANGAWYFHVKAQNGAGWGVARHYTVNIDTVAPGAIEGLTSSTHPVPAGWYSNDLPALSWSAATDAGSGVAGYSYVLDGVSNTTPVATPQSATDKTYAAQAEGVSHFHIRAVDNAGNFGAVSHYAVRIDTTKPVTTAGGLQAGANSGWRSDSQSVTLPATDSGGSGLAATYYQVDGGALTAYSGAFAVSAAGSTAITYYAIDTAGNVEATRTGYVNIDPTAPVTTAGGLQAGADSGWRNSSQSVTLSASDSGGSGLLTTTYTINGGGPQMYMAPFLVSAIGSTTIIYYSADAAGNVEATKTGYVNIETSAPVTTAGGLQAGANSGWRSSSQSVTLNAIDAGSGDPIIKYRINGGALTTYGDAFTVSAAGSTAITYYATDTAGNVEAIRTGYVNIDPTAPVSAATGLQTGTDSGWRNSSQSVTLSASDSGGSGLVATYYQIDGGALTTYSGAFTVSATGGRAITYYATDAAGNVEATKTGYVNIDLVAPVTTPSGLQADDHSDWAAGLQSFTLSAADSGGSGVASTKYRIDGGTLRTYSGSVAVSGPGSHTVTFYATDAAGNVEATRSGYVNNAGAPTITTLSSPTHAAEAIWYADAAPAFAWTANDGGSAVTGYSYELDQSAGTVPDTISKGAALSTSFAGKADGVYYFHVRAQNAAGWGAASQRIVRIDATKPSTTAAGLQAGNNSGWAAGAQSFTLSAADSGGSGVASTKYQIDGGTPTAYSGAVQVSATGSHTIVYYSTDLAGNVEAIRTGFVNIDPAAPVTTSSGLQGGTGAWRNSSESVTLMAGDPGGSGVSATQYRLQGTSGWLPYTAPFAVSAQGSTTYEYRSTDVAGNVEAAKTLTVRIDATAPDTGNDADSLVYGAAVTVTLTATDELSGVAVTSHSLDGGPWTVGTSVPVAAPADHSNDGVHTISYWSTDAAGNSEPVKTCALLIDSRKPTPTAPARATVRRLGTAALTFKIRESGPNAGSADVTIMIKTRRGKTLKTVELPKQGVNQLLRYKFRCKLAKGSYRFYVSARDAAGNTQSRVAQNALVVK